MINKTPLLALINALLMAALLLACGKPDAQENQAQSLPAHQWPLPHFLREASGLAVASPEFLLAHNDEKGNIYRISIADKSIIKLASIGKPPIDRDFEGIAIAPDGVYLATSKGVLYRTGHLDLTTPKQVVSAKRIPTDAGRRCEIEGLHYLDNKLLLPCKVPLIDRYKNRLVVFAYDLQTGETSEFISIPRDDIPGLKKLGLSAIDATETDYYIVSQNRLLLINRETLKSRAFKLAKKYHRQVEGIAVLEDGSIVLVDDNRKGKSRITHYKSLSELEEK